jgi:hypothetical protein
MSNIFLSLAHVKLREKLENLLHEIRVLAMGKGDSGDIVPMQASLVLLFLSKTDEDALEDLLKLSNEEILKQI